MPRANITLASKADTPNVNGHVFPLAVLQAAVDKLNKETVLVGNSLEEPPRPLDEAIGTTVVGSARIVDGRVEVEVAISTPAASARLPTDFYRRLLDHPIKAGGHWVAEMCGKAVSTATLQSIGIEPDMPRETRLISEARGQHGDS